MLLSVPPVGSRWQPLAADCSPYNPLVQEGHIGSIEIFDVAGFERIGRIGRIGGIGRIGRIGGIGRIRRIGKKSLIG